MIDTIVRNSGRMLITNTSPADRSVIVFLGGWHFLVVSPLGQVLFYCCLWNICNFAYKNTRALLWQAEAIRSTVAGSVLNSRTKTFSFLSQTAGVLSNHKTTIYQVLLMHQIFCQMLYNICERFLRKGKDLIKS